MRVGVPRERKDSERRVAATPSLVRELVSAGHEVLLEAGAGEGSSLPDDEFADVGARVVPDAAEVWGEADLVLKVKEPEPEEYDRLSRGTALFTFLHLAASRPCTEALLAAGTTSLAYETVQREDGSLPLLAPMSEVAGRMAPQAGARFLEAAQGGRGVLLGGVPGVRPGRVVVLGAGTSGAAAARVATGMGADVRLLDLDLERLRAVERTTTGRLTTIASSVADVEREVLEADLVVGAVLVAGARAPTLVSDELAGAMRPGSVLVDLSVDQGGCFAASRPTTHSDPVFEHAGCLFYCVANMPGAVPHTSTAALSAATARHVLALAARGVADAVAADPSLARGVQTVAGRLVSAPVAAAHDLPHVDLREALGEAA